MDGPYHDLPPPQRSNELGLAPNLGRGPQWGHHCAQRVINLLFPPQCPLSDAPVRDHGTFAPAAWAQMQLLAPPWCAGCGLPFAYEEMAMPLCAACAAPDRYAENLTGAGRLTQLRAALHYDEAAAPAILRLKYADRADGVAAFGRLMAQAGRDILARGGVLVPVPLHRGRLRQRRYNQAGLLAAALARRSGRLLDPALLVRTRATPMQKGASRSGRMQNVAGAFAVRAGRIVKGKRVILVDDVLTTGATLLACARPLRRAGATAVSAITLARVVKPDQNAI